MNDLLITFVSILSTVLYIALLARVLLSWFSVGPNSPFYPVIAILYQITEPILAPIRQLLNQVGLRFGNLDFSPMLALILLTVIRGFVIDRLG